MSDEFRQQSFMIPNSQIPVFPNELFQKDRTTFEEQFNAMEGTYLRKLFVAYPNLLQEIILKAIENKFIDLMNDEGHSSHFNLTINGVSLNYGFVRLKGKICVYLKTSEAPDSTAYIQLPIPLEQFCTTILGNLTTSVKTEMKFITPGEDTK